MTNESPSPPPSSRPFPPSLHIQFSAWMSELLTPLISLPFSLFFITVYLPLAMLYNSHFRPGVDALSSVNLDLPPAKRRKGLAGSIVSTALSAALIGTAVGLTMYRLWVFAVILSPAIEAKFVIPDGKTGEGWMLCHPLLTKNPNGPINRRRTQKLHTPTHSLSRAR